MRWDNLAMRFRTIWILLTSVGCLERPADNSVDNLTLQEIGQRITGHYWKLKRIENDKGIKEFDLSSDQVKYFEFEGLKGIAANFTDNHDGSFTTESHEPTCELKEKGKRKFIEYSLIFNDNWEHEIKSISQDELVLADSSTTWTYVKFKVE
jgi:hypothetical protein